MLKCVIGSLSVILLTALSLSMSGCGVPSGPVVIPPQPPPATRLVQATIRGEAGTAPNETKVNLTLEGQSLVVDCPITDSRAVCTLPDAWPRGEHGAHLTIIAPDYDNYNQRLAVDWSRSIDLVDIILEPSFKPLPRITINGKFFGLDNGSRWTAIEASDFNLLNRYLAGEDIRPILSQRAETGFNLLRVWTAYDVCPSGQGCQPIGRLVPSEHPELYERVPPFLKLLSKYGLYAEFTAFTGPYNSTLPSEVDKLAHWNRLVASLQGSSNALLELINEYNHPANSQINLGLFVRPAGILTSHGSGLSDGIGPEPMWDYSTYHPGLGGEWMRKAVHNGMEDVADRFNVPALLNETTRFPDNDSSLAHAFDVGRGCALLQAGCAFHSVAGKSSNLWSGLELNLAQEWARGALSVDLRCQGGSYVHRTDLEGPEILRAYERAGTGLGAMCVTTVRR